MWVMHFPEEDTAQAKAHGGRSSMSSRNPLQAGAQVGAGEAGTRAGQGVMLR